MDTKIIAILAVAVVVVAAVAVVVVVNDGDNFNGVIYDGNGGKTLEGDKTTVSVTSTDVQEGNIFEYENHVFTAWNTKADGTGDSYKPGDSISYPSNGNVKLYAQWGYALAINWYTEGTTTKYDFKFIMTDNEGNTQNLAKFGGSVAIPKDGNVTIQISEYGEIKWEKVDESFVGTINQGGVGNQYTVKIKTDDASETKLDLSDSGIPTFHFKFDRYAMVKIIVYINVNI